MKIVHSLIIFLFCLFVSTMEAQTWTAIGSPTGYKNIRALSMDSTGNVLYAADELHVLKSSDFGTTWDTTSGTLAGARAITSKYGRKNIIVASGPTFFQRSVDSGATWSNVATGTTNKPTALARFRGQAYTMILGRKYGSTSERAIAVSNDSGATWTDKLSASYKPRIFDIAVNPGTSTPSFAIAAGGPDGPVATGRGLFYSDNDYGNTWNPRGNGSNDPSWTAVALQYHTVSTENIVYAGTADGKLYKCRWNSLFSNMTLLTAFPPGHNFPDTVRAIRISPSDSLTVFVATDRSIYKTTNGGTSWSCISTGMMDSRVYSLEVSTANSAKLVVGSRGYVYRSTDSGANWTSISSSTTRPLPFYSLVTIGSDLWSSSSELTIGSKYDGSSWNTQRLGNKDSIFYGRHSDSYLNGSGTRYIFHSGVQDDRSRVYRSTDGGSTFLLQNDFKTDTVGTACEGIVQDPSKPSLVYAFGSLEDDSPKNFFSSTDYGGSWTKTTGYSATGRWFAFAPLGDGTGVDASSKFIYAGTNGHGLRRAQNLSSWPAVSTNTIANTKTIYAFSGNVKKVNTAYAGTEDGLYFSNNANDQTDASVQFTQTWSGAGVKKVLIDPRFTDSAYKSHFVFWVATNNTIYRSEDSGRTAQSVIGNLPSSTVINDLRSNASDSTLILVATDRGVYKAQLQTSPTLTAPASNATNILYCISSTENQVFTWSAIGGATSYDIQIDDTADFRNPEFSSSPTTNQYSLSSNLMPSTKYYWHVRSSDGTNFGKSPYSPPDSFTTVSGATGLPGPTLLSPSNGATGVATNPMLSWSAVPGAVKYRVSVSAVFSTITTGTSCRATGLSAFTHYYWSVTGLNCNGSDTTSTRDFMTGCCEESNLGGGGNDSSKAFHTAPAELSEVREFGMEQNYPNPFNPSTRFNYALPVAAHVKLRIFNTLGQVVATIVDRDEQAGRQSVEYNAGHLPSGLYFYRLDANQFTSIKKMLLIK
jgi:photosystem II stability/assembly factor-like uncharacterized protein